MIATKPSDTVESYKRRTIKRIVLAFSVAEYDAIVKRLAEVCDRERLTSHSEAVAFLIEQDDRLS